MGRHQSISKASSGRLNSEGENTHSDLHIDTNTGHDARTNETAEGSSVEKNSASNLSGPSRDDLNKELLDSLDALGKKLKTLQVTDAFARGLLLGVEGLRQSAQMDGHNSSSDNLYKLCKLLDVEISSSSSMPELLLAAREKIENLTREDIEQLIKRYKEQPTLLAATVPSSSNTLDWPRLLRLPRNGGKDTNGESKESKPSTRTGRISKGADSPETTDSILTPEDKALAEPARNKDIYLVSSSTTGGGNATGPSGQGSSRTDKDPPSVPAGALVLNDTGLQQFLDKIDHSGDQWIEAPNQEGSGTRMVHPLVVSVGLMDNYPLLLRCNFDDLLRWFRESGNWVEETESSGSGQREVYFQSEDKAVQAQVEEGSPRFGAAWCYHPYVGDGRNDPDFQFQKAFFNASIIFHHYSRGERPQGQDETDADYLHYQAIRIQRGQANVVLALGRWALENHIPLCLSRANLSGGEYRDGIPYYLPGYRESVISNLSSCSLFRDPPEIFNERDLVRAAAGRIKIPNDQKLVSRGITATIEGLLVIVKDGMSSSGSHYEVLHGSSSVERAASFAFPQTEYDLLDQPTYYRQPKKDFLSCVVVYDPGQVNGYWTDDRNHECNKIPAKALRYVFVFDRKKKEYTDVLALIQNSSRHTSVEPLVPPSEPPAVAADSTPQWVKEQNTIELLRCSILEGHLWPRVKRALVEHPATEITLPELPEVLVKWKRADLIQDLLKPKLSINYVCYTPNA